MSDEREQEGPAEAGSQRRGERCEPKADRPRELGGPKGPEPTRYGDWERAGRCIDF